MTLSQAHEKLRLALNYRVQRGTMSVSLLARTTGISQTHCSNFLHGQRGLSLASMDAVLLAQGLAVELLPLSRARERI